MHSDGASSFLYHSGWRNDRVLRTRERATSPAWTPSASARHAVANPEHTHGIRSQVILVDVVVASVGSLYVLWTPVLRTRRTVAFLVVLAGTLLAANVLHDSNATAGLKILVIVAYLVGIIRYPHVLAGLTAAEAAFDGDLRSLLRPVKHAHGRWLRAYARAASDDVRLARQETREACNSALARLADLSPPNWEWEQTAELVSAYLSALRIRAGGPELDETAQAPSDADVTELQDRFAQGWNVALGVTHRSRRGQQGS